MVSVITADMEYQIVTSKTLHGNDIGIINFPSMGEQGGLESLVRAEIEKGWIPLGGVIRGKTDGETVWAQAMIRQPQELPSRQAPESHGEDQFEGQNSG